MAMEKKTNPFLRPNAPELRRTLCMENASDVEVFAETRRRKDSF
jgi:hydroxyacylglutathione hydrolase